MICDVSFPFNLFTFFFVEGGYSFYSILWHCFGLVCVKSMALFYVWELSNSILPIVLSMWCSFHYKNDMFKTTSFYGYYMLRPTYKMKLEFYIWYSFMDWYFFLSENEKVEGEQLQEWLSMVVAPAELNFFIKGKEGSLLPLQAGSGWQKVQA